MEEVKAVLPTVSGLRPYQTGLLAKKYRETGNWGDVKVYAYSENIFESSRKSTSDRYSHHLVKILSSLDEKQLEVVAEGSDKDRRTLLWLGFCLSFSLIGGFARDVVSEKYRNHSLKLKAEDLWEYLIDKSVEYPNLADITPAVRSKVKSVVFYNLRDAELLNGLDEIQPAYLSFTAKQLIPSAYLSFFPGEE